MAKGALMIGIGPAEEETEGDDSVELAEAAFAKAVKSGKGILAAFQELLELAEGDDVDEEVDEEIEEE
jgi:hypothetical protein